MDLLLIQVLICLAAVSLFWVSRLDQGIQMFDAVTIIPMLQLSWTILSVISGGIYFKEFDDFTVLQVGAGCMMMMQWQQHHAL